MTTLGPDARELCDELGIPWEYEPAKLEMLVQALKSEGDRRAAEMRERCANACESQHGSAAFQATWGMLANAIRALPIDTEPK